MLLLACIVFLHRFAWGKGLSSLRFLRYLLLPFHFVTSPVGGKATPSNLIDARGYLQHSTFSCRYIFAG